MKTLILVRHAKSDWGNEELADIFRPLNERGYSDARILSAQLAQKIATPGYWLTSPAIRAYSTALIFSEAFKYKTDNLVIQHNIYEASVKTLQQIVASLPEKQSCVILFGHNPGFTKFVNEFSDSFADNVPTCGIISLTSDTDSWKDFLSAKAKNDFYLYPKEFK